MKTVPTHTVFEVIGLELTGAIALPEDARGVVLFVHAVGGSRHDATDAQIAQALNRKGIATVLVDLLTEKEQKLGAGDGHFDPITLGARVVALADDLALRRPTQALRGGLCGTGAGAAGALIAAAARPVWANAVLSRAGRPDLAGEFVRLVRCPTLLVVGETDGAVREVNEQAESEFPGTARVAHVPGASVLRGEPKAVTLAAELARDWFAMRLAGRARPEVHR